MSGFTNWLEESRRSGLPLSREQARAVLRTIYIALRDALQRRFPGGKFFGSELGEDLAGEMSVWMLDDPPKTAANFPRRVRDSKTLMYFLIDKACKRSYDRAKATRAGGGSSLIASGSESEVTPATFDSVMGAMDAVEAAEETVRQVLDGVRRDLLALNSDDTLASRHFELKLKTGVSEVRAASDLGIPVSTAHLFGEQAEFCMLRRFGFTTDELMDTFGPRALSWNDALKLKASLDHRTAT